MSLRFPPAPFSVFATLTAASGGSANTLIDLRVSGKKKQLLLCQQTR